MVQLWRHRTIKPFSELSKTQRLKVSSYYLLIVANVTYLILSSQVMTTIINRLVATTPATQDHPSPLLLPTTHVGFGLSGNVTGFLSEFEVALKSVLLHAPLERDMHVHIIADQDAYQSLRGIFNHTGLSTWVTRNSIEVHAYDITPALPKLEHLIFDTFAKGYNSDLSNAGMDHTIGAYFRLFANSVIPATVKHLMYLDTDVVIMANLEELWRQVEMNPDALFHWGRGMCSGFVVFNVPRMSEIWTLAGASPLKSMEETYECDPNDQLLLISVNVTHPGEVAILADGWDMTLTEKWLHSDEQFVYKFPKVGMLHLNGGRDDAYWINHPFLINYPDSWGNANYSVSMPWKWAQYQASSMIRPSSKGKMIKIAFLGKNTSAGTLQD